MHHASCSSKTLVGEFQIFIAAVFFGVNFVCDKYALIVNFGPFTFLTGYIFVCLLIFVSFIPFIRYWTITKTEQAQSNVEEESLLKALQSGFYLFDESTTNVRKKAYNKDLLLYGFLKGVTFFLAMGMILLGLETETAPKAGFFNAMIVIFVPLFEWTIPQLNGKFSWFLLIGASISFIGLYFLAGCSVNSNNNNCFGGKFEIGEIYLFISSLAWAWNNIFAVVAHRLDSIDLNIIGFCIALIFSLICALSIEYESSWIAPYATIYHYYWIILLAGILEAIGSIFSSKLKLKFIVRCFSN
jgi:drug/metabolite transporter (DMT)-like permease